MDKRLTVGLTWLVGVAIIVAWLCVLWEMWWRVDSATDAAWTRMVAIMTALQAVAFAAAGALFGVKVQEVETDKAKDGEAKAKVEKSKAVSAAEEGKKLAAMVEHAIAGGSHSGSISLRADEIDLSGLRHQAERVRDIPLP